MNDKDKPELNRPPIVLSYLPAPSSSLTDRIHCHRSALLPSPISHHGFALRSYPLPSFCSCPTSHHRSPLPNMSRRTTTTTTKAPASCTKDGRYLKKGSYFLRTPPEEWNLTDFLKREYVNRVSQRKLFGTWTASLARIKKCRCTHHERHRRAFALLNEWKSQVRINAILA
jgi:hypothetical protein